MMKLKEDLSQKRFRRVASSEEPEPWVLFHRPDCGGETWVNYKLAVPLTQGAERKKHRYWLAWNSAEKRQARRGDAEILKAQLPAIYSAVETVMRKTSSYPSQFWLPDER
jgi:hypothetical protein